MIAEHDIKREEGLAEIRKLAHLLDSRFRLPFGWKIGWDGILGLIPGIGDIATNSLSLYIIFRAALLGCPPSVLLRMGLNLAVDNLLDLIPLLGNLFDFVWKANNKNLALLESYLLRPRRVTIASRVLIALTLALILAVLGGLIYFAFLVLRFIWTRAVGTGSFSDW